jgi:hypothetical protein
VGGQSYLSKHYSNIHSKIILVQLLNGRYQEERRADKKLERKDYGKIEETEDSSSTDPYKMQKKIQKSRSTTFPKTIYPIPPHQE